MRCWLVWSLVAALGACAEIRPPVVDSAAVINAEVVQPGAVCSVGPDGGPLEAAGEVVAERGIGGTGSPHGAHPVLQQLVAQQAPSGVPGGALADRGIGGTGIVGVVTGFASVCVDGLEVRYDGSVAVDINGQPATTDQLRVGQLVAVEASGPAEAPVARAISVRAEVTGPIDAIELGSGAIIVSGQRVILSPGAWGAARFGLGDWTSVSGLRQPDGTIFASRMDNAPSGALMVRGRVSLDGSKAHIGSLVLDGPAASGLHSGDFVVATGSVTHGVTTIEAVKPDALSNNPMTYFGASVDHVVVQAIVRVSNGTVWLTDQIKVPAAAGKSTQGSASGNAIISLERGSNGTFVATGVRYTGYREAPAQPTAAPVHKSNVTTQAAPAPHLAPPPPTPVGMFTAPAVVAMPNIAAPNVAAPIAAAPSVAAPIISAPVGPVSAPISASTLPTTIPASASTPVVTPAASPTPIPSTSPTTGSGGATPQGNAGTQTQLISLNPTSYPVVTLSVATVPRAASTSTSSAVRGVGALSSQLAHGSLPSSTTAGTVTASGKTGTSITSTSQTVHSTK